MDLYQQFIYKSRYARWDYDKKRREEFPETVERYLNFFDEHLKENHNFIMDKKDKDNIRENILNLKVMPSMRALMTAGKALKKENIAGYNCSYIPIDNLKSFDELLYILMNGTGAGISVEKSNIDKLPIIPDQLYPSDTVIIVADTKLGWAKALRELFSLLFSGNIPKYDLSKIRPKGSPLKTFGGRASGPEPLKELFDYVINTVKNAAGRKLSSLECHDICCKIANIVVVGGVRRSALISFSDLEDIIMRNAKSGQWWTSNIQRTFANNSAVYQTKPNMEVFMSEWKALYESKSGERGIFNIQACLNKIESLGRREPNELIRSNPCGEILLLGLQFCNLTEVVCRKDDTFKDLKAKVKIATILGTIQSTLTNFRYIRREWSKNCEEERLLGVSLTGIMDCKLLNNISLETARILHRLKKYAIEVNKEWSKKLDINPSVAITTVKPSGTVSALVNSSSGIHPRFDSYYIRRVRGDKKDSLIQFLSNKIPSEDCVNKPESIRVFSFVQKSPEGCKTVKDFNAIDQLNFWLMYKTFWCEHNPSCTIYVKDDEWMEVGAWVYRNFNLITGITFLPYTDHIYQQAPYESISKEEYLNKLDSIPETIDWDELSKYEKEDFTAGTQILACTGDSCELVDLL